uniref:Uncharacterized protein n=1 Tax=Globodera rostochiensis TaxID=31243 RepID=A0A914H536_GLORO
MSKIGLCVKFWWFIFYVQIVLLHLAHHHHHQSANAVNILEVYIYPPSFQYTVTVFLAKRDANGQNVTKKIGAGIKTTTKPDGTQMIKLNKTKLAEGWSKVNFKFTRTNDARWASGTVTANFARQAQQLALDYDDLLHVGE